MLLAEEVLQLVVVGAEKVASSCGNKIDDSGGGRSVLGER